MKIPFRAGAELRKSLTEAQKFCADLPKEPGRYRWEANHMSITGLRLSWVDDTHEWREYHLPSFVQPSYFRSEHDTEILQGMKLTWEPVEGDEAYVVIGHPIQHECPYCGKLPTLHGVRNTGKFVVAGSPYTQNSFWLKCCAWGNSPHVEDPRPLISKRTEVLGREANLATMVKRLTRNHPDKALRTQALDYLKKHNLTSPLR